MLDMCTSYKDVASFSRWNLADGLFVHFVVFLLKCFPDGLSRGVLYMCQDKFQNAVCYHDQ